jgi:hypothetical protein
MGWETVELDTFDTDELLTDRERRMAETEGPVLDRRRREPEREFLSLAEIKARGIA